jgi:hypothetical protein
MIIRTRKKTENQPLSNVTKSDWNLKNKNRPSKINQSPKNERKTNPVEPLFQKQTNRFLKLRGLKKQSPTQDNKKWNTWNSK